jgi:SAM-dependent methyltransferase
VTVYQGSYAELYDVFYADKPYAAEAAFVDELLLQHGPGRRRGRLLDVACGTGRHAVELAIRGWHVVGFDRSAEMLEAARRRAGNLQLSFRQGDMAALPEDLGTFDAATCLFDSIGYAITNAAILATLTGIRAHLSDPGLVALEFWHAPAMLRGYEPNRRREWSVDGRTIVRESRTTIDVPVSVAEVDYVVKATSDGREAELARETHRNRFFLVPEMALLLADAGFEPIDWFAGYSPDGPITADTWHVLAVARSARLLAA